MHRTDISRRSFLAATAAATAGIAAAKPKKIPVGLELYSVRDELKQDLHGTVTAVAKMGYEGVEFFSPYFQWTTEQAKDVRKLLDGLGIVCYSTHNSASSFDPTNIDRAIELNQIIGSKYIVMASAGKVDGLDGWRAVADKLNAGAEKMKKAGMRAGFHNHQLEFKPIDGVKPIEILAKNTSKDVILQLDVGTCIDAGSDPVAWINANPKRIECVHCKDFSKTSGKGYRVLLGDGDAPWKQIFQAAEKKGGVKFYLVEQEGADLPPLETAKRCLENFRKLRA